MTFMLESSEPPEGEIKANVSNKGRTLTLHIKTLYFLVMIVIGILGGVASGAVSAYVFVENSRIAFTTSQTAKHDLDSTRLADDHQHAMMWDTLFNHRMMIFSATQ